jgi:hypothetical protein
VEALAMGKPVLCFELDARPNMSQLADLAEFKDYAAIPEDFKTFFSEFDSRRAEAEKLALAVEKAFFHKLDGKSTERVAEFIAEI